SRLTALALLLCGMVQIINSGFRLEEQQWSLSPLRYLLAVEMLALAVVPLLAGGYLLAVVHPPVSVLGVLRLPLGLVCIVAEPLEAQISKTLRDHGRRSVTARIGNLRWPAFIVMRRRVTILDAVRDAREGVISSVLERLLTLRPDANPSPARVALVALLTV